MNKHEVKYYNTGKRIKAAMVDLLEIKNFSEISISEICGKADINRSTFYAHYYNIAELIVDLKRSLMSDFLNRSETLANIIVNKNDAFVKDNVFIVNSILSECLEYIKDHRKQFILYDAGIFDIGNETLQYINELLIIPILKSYGITDKTSIEYMTLYYVSGANAIIKKWLKDNCEKSIEEVCDIIKRCLNISSKTF